VKPFVQGGKTELETRSNPKTKPRQVTSYIQLAVMANTISCQRNVTPPCLPTTFGTGSLGKLVRRRPPARSGRGRPLAAHLVP
jgi:hypothetical protein